MPILIPIKKLKKKIFRKKFKPAIALILTLILLVQAILPIGNGSILSSIDQTQAQTIDFLPSEYKNYIYEHTGNQFTAYFGDKNSKTNHHMRFEKNGKGVEISLLPNQSQASNTSMQKSNEDNPSPRLTPEENVLGIDPNSPYATASSEIAKIDEQLATISGEFKNIEEKIKEVEKEVKEVGAEIAEIVQGTTIIYRDAKEAVKVTEASPNIDVLYSAISDGIKEEIVIKSPIPNPQLPITFTLSLDGVYFAKLPGEDQWTFLDEESNEELFYFEKPYAVDAAGVRTDAVSISLSNPQPTTYNLQLSLDPAWLSSPERVYPIMIDPTVRLANAKKRVSAANSLDSATSSARLRDINRKRDKIRLNQGDEKLTVDFKNIESNPKATHRFESRLSTGGRVLLSDRKDQSVGYKLISGYDDVFWVEFKMKDPEKVSAQIGTQSARISNGKFGQSKAIFKPKDYLTVEYEVLEDRVKANYILTNKPPNLESALISTESAQISEFSIPFSLNYPWGVLIPQANEDDGSISLLRDSQGDSQVGSGEIMLIAPPVAIDASGKKLPTFFEIPSNLPYHPALPDSDTEGFAETISLNLLVEIPNDATYPISIDPVAIDTSAIAGATNYGNSRKIIRDNQGNGNLIAVYVDSLSDLHIRTSSDGGQTWTNQVATALTVSNLGMAQDKSGQLHLATEDSGNVTYRSYLIARTNNNITSITASTVATIDQSTKSHRPSIIVDAGNNAPAMAWSCEGTGGASQHRVRFARGRVNEPSISDWCNAAESSCGSAASDCVDVNTGSNDPLFTDSAANGVIHPVLVQMPGIVEPLTNQGGNLYIYAAEGTVSTRGLQVVKATINTGGTPNFKWSWGSASSEQTSDVLTGRYTDLTAARDLRNNRIVFAWTTDADTDSMDTVPVTQVRYRSGSDDATTDISPATTFSATGGGTDIGDEFQLTVDPTRNEYLLFYANSSNNIEYRKVNPDTQTFGWINEQPAGETSIFNSVDIFSTTLAYAVGGNGRIYRWNGTSWINEQPAGVTNTFKSVDIFSTTLAYAVASDGRIYRWNGTSWINETPSGTDGSDDFQSVDVFSATLAYAVGGTFTTRATLYKWNGTSWINEQPEGETNILNSVDIFSTTLAYAVGGNGRIYRWNGTSWINETPAGDTSFLESVDIFSTTLAYAVGGNGRIYRWNGTSWINETPSGTDGSDDFESVDVFSATLAYAVGGLGTIRATLYRWNGTSWINEQPAGMTTNFFSVDIFSTTLAYAVGDAGRIYRWNGTSWTNEQPAGETNILESVDIFSTTLAYVVGRGGKIYKWTGGTIPYPVDTGTEQTFPAVPEMKYPGDQEAHSMIDTLSTAVDVEFERSYPNLSDASSPIIVAASADDAYHLDNDVAADTQDISASVVILGRSNVSTQNYHAGLRFQGVSVSQGTTISSAYLTFSNFARTGGIDVPFIIYGEDVDNSDAFATSPSSQFVGDRTRTARSKSYTVKFALTSYRFDVTELVQEVVCRGAAASLPCLGDFNGAGNWASSNALTLLLISTETGAVDQYVSIDAQDGTNAIEPTLEINLADASGKNYSRGILTAAPATSDPYTNPNVSFANLNFTDVGSNDAIRSDITNIASASATRVDTPAYHFKQNNSNNTDNIDVTWDGQSTIKPSDKTVTFQVYNNTTGLWESEDTDTTDTTDDFTMTGATTGGDYYTTEYYDTKWTNDTPAGETNAFRSVDIFSTSLAYAVGDAGRIYRWNGTSWTNEQPSGETNVFRSVDIFSTTLAYAVGSIGRIYRWNGTSWSNETVAGSEFYKVEIFSSTLGYAVGLNGMIFKWNGTSWSDETPAGETDAFVSVDIFSTTLAFAVGDAATVYKWNGTSWTNDPPTSSDSSDNFQSIEIFSTTLAYTVGGTADSRSSIYKWNGTSWINDPPGQGENDIYRSVDIFSTTLAFAAGDDGTLWKWNGTSWINDPPPGTRTSDDIDDVQIYSYSLAYAVGGFGSTRASVFKWNGLSWGWDTPPLEVNDLNDMYTFSPSLAIAVGASGRIWRYNASSSQYWTYWRVYQAANDGQGALGEGQILRTDQISFTFSASGGVTTGDQMRHGNWFLNQIEQYFTF